nr:MAG TPA: protein of unknown function (DUF4330) [Caudoviricetes sp.]
MFEKVNIPDCIVIIGLVTALILAIFILSTSWPCPSPLACSGTSAAL